MFRSVTQQRHAMPITFDAIISDRNMRLMLAAFALLFSVGAVTFVIVRLQAVERLQTENLRLSAEVADLKRQLSMRIESVAGRIAPVEQMVYGTLAPELSVNASPDKPTLVLSAPARWQVNRDRELRARILALETWRLKQEQPR
jgi:hypothetical protein